MNSVRGRVYDFSELADFSFPNVTASIRPIPKNRRPDPDPVLNWI